MKYLKLFENNDNKVIYTFLIDSDLFIGELEQYKLGKNTAAKAFKN